MINKIKAFFKKEKIEKAASKSLPEAMSKPKTAVQIANEKIYAERVRKHEEKVDAEAKHCMERLNEHLESYFNNFSDDEETNQFAYDLLNKEWKSYCQRYNVKGKYFELKPDRFEVEVARIVSENKQFQKEEIIDLTKIK